MENRTGTKINWFGVSHIIAVIKESRTDNLFLVPLKMRCRTWTMFLLNRTNLNLCSGYDECPVAPLKMHKISNNSVSKIKGWTAVDESEALGF